MRNPSAKLWRLRALLSALLGVEYDQSPTTSPILQVLSSIVNQTSTASTIDSISQQMVEPYEVFQSRLEATNDSDAEMGDTDDSFFEICEICDAEIPFEHFGQSTCGQGHRFGEYPMILGILIISHA